MCSNGHGVEQHPLWKAVEDGDFVTVRAWIVQLWELRRKVEFLEGRVVASRQKNEELRVALGLYVGTFGLLFYGDFVWGDFGNVGSFG